MWNDRISDRECCLILIFGCAVEAMIAGLAIGGAISFRDPLLGLLGLMVLAISLWAYYWYIKLRKKVDHNGS